MTANPRIDTQASHAAIGADRGWYETLGDEHSALFVAAGRTLIVTFENLDHVAERGEDRLPWGYGFVNTRGWSMLGIMAHGWTWYRAPEVWGFFDRLRDEGFFAGFDRVVFYGASMGAYAAAAFSSSAPGSTVIAISPQATLSRDTAIWETRYRKAWKRDFSDSSPYAYAPEQIASADRVYLFYDPMAPLDAMHAALFRGGNVEKFHCRFMGHRIASLWLLMGVLKPVVTACVDGSLTRTGFYRHLRARRGTDRYERLLLATVQERKRPDLVVRLCQSVLARRRAPRFRAALREARLVV